MAATLERTALGILSRGFSDIPVRLVGPSGEGVLAAASLPPAFVLRLNTWLALAAALVRPDPGLGNAYMEGDIEVEGDLVALLAAVNEKLAAASTRTATPTRLRPRSVNRTKSRRNSRRHYALGNDFFRLWLDTSMTYTCAYFDNEAATLEQAQAAKLDLICRKLAIRPGERVVEAGCGWGSLAVHMAKYYGARVRAFNVCAEQLEFAREAARRSGVEKLVEFVDADYREISGSSDVFVSVGMLEALGRDDYPQLGRVISGCLAPGGRGLLHSIGRVAPYPTSRWIDRHIFPGGYTPALEEILDIVRSQPLEIVHTENLREHYALTLSHWRSRFEGNCAEVERMFDARFVKMWRLYLASAEAAFRSNWLQLYQVLFRK